MYFFIRKDSHLAASQRDTVPSETVRTYSRCFPPMRLSTSIIKLPPLTHPRQSPVQEPCTQCYRRRSVCDFLSPACTPCLIAGLACSDQESKDTISWLPPNHVLSRPRRRRGQNVLPFNRALGNRAGADSAALKASTSMIIRNDDLRSEMCDLHDAIHICKPLEHSKAHEER